MCLNSTQVDNALCVEVPLTRPDVLHACDVAEDVAIAFGYNQVVSKGLVSQTIGRELGVN